MARWTESFDLYLAAVDDKPLVILCDLAAADHGPLLTHSQRVLLRCPMLAPREDGLVGPEEAQKAAELEDRMVAAMAEHDGIYVGRTMATGLLLFFFYVPVSVRPEVSDPVYDVAVRRKADPEWSDYFDFLYPDAEPLAQIMNRRLLQVLEEHGDDFAKPRLLEHTALFLHDHTAAAAGVALTQKGFEVEAPQKTDNGWQIAFRRVDTLGEGRIDDVVHEILLVVLGLDGQYDGWGCEIP